MRSLVRAIAQRHVSVRIRTAKLYFIVKNFHPNASTDVPLRYRPYFTSQHPEKQKAPPFLRALF
ncbi:hypothetical protein H6F73_08585 [Microcoleus sp. FACHB-68]|nr:hypothetical protein [Microcoleus sp. FACHB-68]